MPLEKITEKLRGKKDQVSRTDLTGLAPGITSDMPVVPHKVLVANVSFYSDEACKEMVEGAKIVILRPLEPEGFDVLDIVPSTKHYSAGQYVTWQLNNKKLWENCYYRSPFTGETERAWSMHVEFVGKVIDEPTVLNHQKKIKELEIKYAPLEIL